MEELEAILLNTKINANFDPESEEDIAWVAGEIEKILLDTPQLKTLEKKLNMTDDINDSLDAALNGLKKVTDVTKMVHPVKKKIVKTKFSDEPKKCDCDKDKNDTKPLATNATKKAEQANETAKANSTANASEGEATPAEGETKKEGDKATGEASAPAEGAAKAQQNGTANTTAVVS